MTNLHVRFRRRQARSRGQSLVEFSLVVVPFVFIMMGIFDLGRGIYMMNGTAEAAREIARVTSVHSGCPLNAVSCDLGSSTETANVVATQRRLVPAWRSIPRPTSPASTSTTSSRPTTPAAGASTTSASG